MKLIICKAPVTNFIDLNSLDERSVIISQNPFHWGLGFNIAVMRPKDKKWEFVQWKNVYIGGSAVGQTHDTLKELVLMTIKNGGVVYQFDSHQTASAFIG